MLNNYPPNLDTDQMTQTAFKPLSLPTMLLIAARAVLQPALGALPAGVGGQALPRQGPSR